VSIPQWHGFVRQDHASVPTSGGAFFSYSAAAGYVSGMALPVQPSVVEVETAVKNATKVS
jgi:hypothetical protein